jgi:virginiamycin B lyase
MTKSRWISILAAYGAFPSMFAGLSLVSAPAGAAVTITEYPIPTAGRNPLEIVTGLDGNLWFTESAFNGEIGRITPSGVITEFPLAASDIASNPGPIAAGSDAIWFRENFRTVDRMTPDGHINQYQGVTPSDPIEMTLGPDGVIWYSSCLSIGRLDVTNGVTEFNLPLPPSFDPVDFCTSDGEAVGITTGADGNIWFAVDGYGATEHGDSSRGQIGQITPDGHITLFDAGGYNPNEIAAGADGNLWFTDAQHNVIGRSTLSGAITVYPIPSGSGARYITAGPDGNLWFTENSDRIGRITPNGDIAETSLPAGSGPSGITVGPDHAIWFTEAGSNKIGRLDPGGCLPDARTLCLGIFRVSTAWQGSGQSGTGNATSITPNTGAFWFFDPSNIEVFVKILDTCRESGKFSVYVNGLTHLGVTVTVMDTESGTSKTFVNPEGAPFSLMFDDATFACP